MHNFYKVIAKIIVNRMRLALPDIIHEAQYSFIKGQNIIENVALAHDMCYNLSSNKFIAKFILLKAFDSIN